MNVSKLAAGTYPLICGRARINVREAQGHGGKNIGIVFPESISVGVGDLIFVPIKAQNLNAAILFMTWKGALEAPGLLGDVNFTKYPNFDGTEKNNVIRGKKVAYARWEDVASPEGSLLQIFQAMGMPEVRAKKEIEITQTLKKLQCRKLAFSITGLESLGGREKGIFMLMFNFNLL